MDMTFEATLANLLSTLLIVPVHQKHEAQYMATTHFVTALGMSVIFCLTPKASLRIVATSPLFITIADVAAPRTIGANGDAAYKLPCTPLATVFNHLKIHRRQRQRAS